ncbi:DDX27 [Cordylochernes scorpioides]|uniref:DDX27 n=1 Tax=Cordylochernes scorpioides TaxID=51811 RepID=A0ABY6KAZ7_9ARAC|nr:DDX27 [Cordylochernes scorpioides]
MWILWGLPTIYLLQALNEQEIYEPTDIQKDTIPVALEGKDIYACAATGTGKTLAFMLPVLERLHLKPEQATRVLVLTPTRELALQVHEVVQRLKKHIRHIYCTVLAGGLNLNEQAALLSKIPDIVVATPGRLLDHLNSTPSFGLEDIEVLILDEADRMLDEEFIDQVKEILSHCYVHRQTMLFSATMSDQVNELADITLKNPVKIFVNDEDQVAINLSQEFIKISSSMEKRKDAILAGNTST